MIQWTKTAQEALESYLSSVDESMSGSGADPQEVMDDLRRHVDEAVAEAGLQIVTEQDVRRILARIGPTERSTMAPPESVRVPADDAHKLERRKFYVGLLFLGVILPLITLVIEISTHMCAGVFFDPIPTWWHVALVSIVPVVNFFAWWTIRNSKATWLKQLGWANAAALAISGFYALLFLPLIPPGVVAVLFFGWGLLPLSPILSFIAACTMRRHLRTQAADSPLERLRGFWPGFSAATAAIALTALTPALTHYLSGLAISDSAQTRARAVKWLRKIGTEQVLLTDCYGSTSWSRNSPLALNFTGTPLPPEEARNIYFRVTGRPFNAVPPPQRNYSRGGWNWLDDFTWDAERGGESVAGRVRGLSLAQSRLDELLDADAAWSYVEWVLEFRNTAEVAREGRAQIGLPPGGFVSRLTLWVNGEEREAAFAGTAQTREAYRQVAIVQKRDPVLVTSCGLDRVLMQCFPVPPNGGTMKVRLGITAPTILTASNQVASALPAFLERNFGIPAEVKHSVWIEAPQPLKASNVSLQPQPRREGRYAIRGELTDRELGSAASVVWADRASGRDRAWVMDHTTNDGGLIWQTVKPLQRLSPDRLVLVIDGTAGMNEFYSEIAETIAHVPPSVEISVVHATDDAASLITRSSSHSSIADAVRALSATGGQDNIQALLRAWDLASAKTNSVVVWIHGPQPVLLGSIEALKQRLLWQQSNSSELNIFDLQTKCGPNRVLEKIDSRPLFSSVPRLGTVKEDLERLFEHWRGGSSYFQTARERAASTNVVVANLGQQTSKHLARLWAYDEILKKIAAHRISDAVALASRYQLVTPVSGAVVLESAAQFVQAGLKPVDAATVPSVPEPSTMIFLLAFGSVLALFHFRRRRLRKAP